MGPKELWRWLRAHIKTHTVATLLVFLATFAAFVYYWHNVHANVRKDTHAAYEQQVRILSASTVSRLLLYENFLRGGAGLFAINNSLDQAEWAQYFQPYAIASRFPDIKSIGFSRYLTAAQVSNFVATVRERDWPDFSIKPANMRSVYVPLTLAAQYAGSSTKSIGSDSYAEPTRHGAMQIAAGSGRPAMTGVVTSMGAPTNKQPSFVIYMPVYQTGLPLKTTAERQSALYGFVSVAVNIKSMINALLAQNQNGNFALQFYDTTKSPTAGLAYQSPDFASIAKQHGAIVQTLPFSLYMHHWKVTFVASPNIISANERELPSLVLWRGAFISFVLAGAVWLLTTARERKLTRQKQFEVQTAKDDLLSLASHQLRTPATVVKQYVGMLLQGYGGTISRKAKNMLQYAYDSNERQLEIINQLLYVARLDAGRIVLHKEKVDIGALLQEVCDEQAAELKQRKQRLNCRAPKRPLFAQIDPRYFRMVLENLLGNASKYTPDGGQVHLRVQKSRGDTVVTVRDTGIGISETERAAIFDKFSRVENELSSGVSGSGVGLYLVQQIVSLHGGTIEVSSAPGKGSTFTVHLPGPSTPKIGGEADDF